MTLIHHIATQNHLKILFKMKKLALFMLSAAVIALGSCSKEGDRGPAGPAGAAGADGADANFSTNDLVVTVDDFAGGNYAELTVDFFNQDIWDNGMAMCYVEDSFGYWNTVPSQWHEITGFSYFFDGTGGACGFDAVNGITADYNVRIVTMSMSSYQEMEEAGILGDFEAVMDYLK